MLPPPSPDLDYAVDKEMKAEVVQSELCETSQDINPMPEQSAIGSEKAEITWPTGEESEDDRQAIEKKEKKPVAIKRKTTIRYYEQMNPAKAFPLSVILSKDTVAPVKLDHVKQKQGKKTVTVTKDKPRVKITPCLSGCLVTPASIMLDVTPESANADFWVTPIIEGNINGWIDISYQEEAIEKIPLLVRSVKQTWAKVGAAGAVLSPVISYTLDGFKLDQNTLEGLPRILAMIDSQMGLLLFGLLCTIPFIAAGIFFYLRSQPKEGEILERFFSTESLP